MLLLLLALIGFHANAAIYIVGSDLFGWWDPNGGVAMTYEGEGVYTLTTVISGTVYFVFADGLDSDWSTFNANYRYGPTNGDQIVTPGTWFETQKAGDHGAYQFHGSLGETYTIIFDENYHQFKIDGYVDPLPPVLTYTVVGPKNVFGSDWNETDVNNDMEKGDDGIYTWTKDNVELDSDFEFKIVGNHSWDNEWPQGFGNDWVARVAMPGIYTIVITFNPTDYDITCTLAKTGDVGPEPLFGDLNGDGSVNISDINIIIYAILDDDQNMDYDLNGDGSVNISDVALLIDCILTDHTPTTRTPVATLELIGNELWCHITGEGDIYIDDENYGPAPVDYLVATQTDEYQAGSFIVYAIAQGKEFSDALYVDWELEPLPIEFAEMPVLTYDEATLTVTATSADNVKLFIDGEEVEGNSYTFVKQAFEVTYEVYAYAYADGKEDSEYAYMEITVPGKQILYTCFGDLTGVDDDTQVELIYDATVLWQYGPYIYAKDRTGYGLIYGDIEQTYQQGDVIQSGFGGKKVTYMNEPEVMFPTGFEPAINHVSVNPQVITPDEVNHNNWAHYVLIKNVCIAEDEDPSYHTRTIVDEDGNSAIIFNYKFNAPLPEDLTINYNIYGIVASFEDFYEVFPISFEPAEKPQQMTPSPMAELVRTGAELWCNITGEGDIYIDDEYVGPAPFSFLIATQTDDYQEGSFIVRAIAPGLEPSEPIIVSWELEAKPTEGFSFADMLTTADNTQVVFTHDATVLWQHRYYLFAMDDTGFGLIYGDTGHTYNQGDVIPAGFGGKKMLYMGEPEIQSPTGFQPAVDNVNVSPLVISLEDIGHPLWSHYVVVKNVTIGDQEESYGVRTITDVDGITGAIYSGTFFVDLPEDLSQSYDIYGIINCYKSMYQLLPIRFEPAQ